MTPTHLNDDERAQYEAAEKLANDAAGVIVRHGTFQFSIGDNHNPIGYGRHASQIADYLGLTRPAATLRALSRLDRALKLLKREQYENMEGYCIGCGKPECEGCTDWCDLAALLEGR